MSSRRTELMAKIVWDKDALNKVLEDATSKLQEQVNLALQSTIREVRDEMTGQPAATVYDELVRRLETRIEGLQFNEAELRTVAAAIEDGTLEE